MASAAQSLPVAGPDPNWEYCGVKLTIHNIVIPEERLTPTPSQTDNMDYEVEMDLRIIGCELIQDAGLLLKLPQVAMATAQVLYQRFFYSKSFVRHFYEHYAMACIFLAAKLEECPRRLRDIINVFHHIRQVREKKTPTPVMLDQNYTNLKNQVIKAERRVLKELGFCVHAKHPHKLIICYLQALNQEFNAKLVQTSWNYMNDGLRTDVFVRYLPEAIACACIYLASCKLNIPLPRNPAWWEMFNVDEESVREIGLCLMRLYARPKPNVEFLEAELARLRRLQLEAKERELELKKQSQAGTSPNVTNSTISPSSGTVSDVKNDSGAKQEPPTTTLLASAIATAKAAAATLSSKSDSARSDMVVNNTSDCNRLDAKSNGLVNETKNGSRRNADDQQKTTDAHRTKEHVPVRPSAYAPISPETKKHRSASNSQSSQASPNDDVSPAGSKIPSAYDLTRSRHFRRPRKAAHLRDPSSSVSGSPDASLTPPKHRRLDSSSVGYKKNAGKNRHRSRSTSGDSYSSSPDVRRTHRKRSKNHRRRRHRSRSHEDSAKTQSHSNKSSVADKSSVVVNGGDRIRDSEKRSTHHHHHHHRQSKSESSSRRHLVSHEHRRR